MRITTILAPCLLLIASCGQPAAIPPAPPIDGNAMKGHVQKLASDEMEGRAPGGKGEELATAYISDFYRSIGLKTQLQAVPMVGITSTLGPLRLSGKGTTKTLKYG